MIKRLNIRVPTLKDVDSIRVTDTSARTDIFAESIHRTVTPAERVDDPIFFKDSQPMPLMVVTPDIIARHLVFLNKYKAAAPDGLHRMVLGT